MGNQKEFIAQIEKLKKDFDFAADMAIMINADRLKHVEIIEDLEFKLKKQNKAIEVLLDTLNKIVQAPVPANEREYMSWFVTAKNIAGGAISEYEAEIEAQQWKEGKEVEPAEERIYPDKCTCRYPSFNPMTDRCLICGQTYNPQQKSK